MSRFLQKNSNILDMHSEWVGDSLIRTVTRHFGERNKIMVDVMEFSVKATSKDRARKAAIAAARRVGCMSVDHCSVSDHEIVRQSRDVHTDKATTTKVRSTTFAFGGLAT